MAAPNLAPELTYEDRSTLPLSERLKRAARLDIDILTSKNVVACSNCGRAIANPGNRSVVRALCSPPGGRGCAVAARGS
jgi:hypothetical protein